MKTLTPWRQILVIGIAFFFLIMGWGCSTQKNALPNRMYHSVNAKYNGFFNARQNYREGLTRLSMAHIDNYDHVLHVFRYGNEQQASAISSYMDVVYEKASIVIRRHSMNIRGVEYNRWIDESFYLIARSHYFKRDFNLAILTFEYIVRQYDTDVRYEAKAWIAKSYHQLGRFDDAAQILEQLAKDDSDGLLSRNSRRLYYLVQADHHIRQENYLQAVPFLSRGADLTRNKSEKTRLTFIMAQVYQHGGEFGQAQQTYANVLRMNPSFDLAFQARISMAMAYDPAKGGAGNIAAELERMLRDDKNRSYQDQIYYALAQLNLRQGKENEAVDYLLKSTQASVDNRLQKAMSFKRLGEIHFDRPAYLDASIYYDSAVAFLPPQHEDYRAVNERKVVLSALAGNIRIIEREDSLQRLAGMSEAERVAVIEKIISDLREEERQARLLEQQMMRAASTIAQTRIRGGVGTEDGGWYFYNTTSMSFGRTEFFSRFGDRPLEDLWRISNKGPSGIEMAMDGQEWEEPEEEAGDKFDRNTYLKNIPTTQEAMEASNNRIANAYYNMGMVFKDRLYDYPSAVNSLESLVNRFPDSDRRLHAYYYLYSLLRELQNPSQADMYKNRLVSEFPDSDFAQILGDPDYMRKFSDKLEYASRLYEQTYRSFLNGRFQEVLAKADEADSLDMPFELRSQFAYIKALATGKSGRRSEFRQQLELVVNDYEGQMVHQPASILLASLDTPGSLPIVFEEEETPDSEPVALEMESIFEYKPDAVHFFVFVMKTNQKDITQLRNFVNMFNIQNFGDTRLSASSIFLDDTQQIVTVTNFPDQRAGMEYFEQIIVDEGLKEFETEALTGFIISVENYPLFYQDKNLDAYMAFFRNYYLDR